MVRIPPRSLFPEEIHASARLTDLLVIIDRYFGDRITLRQVRAFIAVGNNDFVGSELTLTDLRKKVGGIPYRSLMVFNKNGTRRHDLIDIESQPGNGRERIVSLTDKGRILYAWFIRQAMDREEYARFNEQNLAWLKSRRARLDRLA